MALSLLVFSIVVVPNRVILTNSKLVLKQDMVQLLTELTKPKVLTVPMESKEPRLDMEVTNSILSSITGPMQAMAMLLQPMATLLQVMATLLQVMATPLQDIAVVISTNLTPSPMLNPMPSPTLRQHMLSLLLQI